jgi:beta-xylosidase
MRNNMKLLTVLIAACSISAGAYAQNPIIRNMYSADPTARVFGDSVYLYPSHDILASPGHGRVGWFCMEEHPVFPSADLPNWRDDGVVVSQYNTPWVDSTKYSMWAPDCLYRNGKYYFYFPSMPDSSYGRGFAIGVAISDKPSGPFIPQAMPIKDVHGIDPNVFIDKDGQPYLYWAQGRISGAKLKDNMLELASDVKVLGNLPDKGLKEGPFVFERNGHYYLTYPHVENKTERLEYAMGDNPLGPFKVTGVIMDESPHCWTNHHSLVKFKGQWYLFYHSNDLSPNFDKARSVRADSLFFNADGTIQKVIPTLRGIGVTKAGSKIQTDRYSAISETGASVNFLDTTNRFLGWETTFDQPGAWIQYNTVNFGKAGTKTLVIRANSATGTTLVLRTTDPAQPPIAEIKVPKTSDWSLIRRAVVHTPSGIKNLVLQQKDGGTVEVDWISFE